MQSKYDSLTMLRNCVLKLPDIAKKLGVPMKTIFNIAMTSKEHYSRRINTDSSRGFLGYGYDEISNQNESKKREWKSQYSYALNILHAIDTYFFAHSEVIEDILFCEGENSEKDLYSLIFCDLMRNYGDLDFLNGYGLVNVFQRIRLCEYEMNETSHFTKDHLRCYEMGILSSARNEYGERFERLFTDSFGLFSIITKNIPVAANSNIYTAKQSDIDGIAPIDKELNNLVNYVMCDRVEDCDIKTPLEQEVEDILLEIEKRSKKAIPCILLFVRSGKQVPYVKKYTRERQYKVKWAFAWMKTYPDKTSSLTIEDNYGRKKYFL